MKKEKEKNLIEFNKYDRIFLYEILQDNYYKRGKTIHRKPNYISGLKTILLIFNTVMKNNLNLRKE